MGRTSPRPEAGMPFNPRKFLMVALLPLLAGCQAADQYSGPPGPPRAESSRRSIPPGLEPLYAPRPPVPMVEEPPPPMPVPPPPGMVPFPTGRLSPDGAEMLLGGDPEALRFLALKQLAERGLVPVEDCAARKDANLGALLPLTAPEPPAAGLNIPIPPVTDVVARFNGLGTGAERGTPASRAAEREFLLDSLLPKVPTRREARTPPDIASARKQQERLNRLEDAGLVTPQQRAEETDALERLIAGGTLPEVLAPPPPPPPPPEPEKKKTSGGRGNRMPGGVSGQLRVIPSPPGVQAPKLGAGAKGPAGMHLLSMGSAAHGDKAWEALTKEHSELAGLGHTVSRADLGELGVTYRLIAGPIDADKAQSLCATLKTRGQACTPTPFPANGTGK
ncbi:MAG TPA: SPOR domain-containing protein [Magnetospirillum sp.]|nr:SPOR domain-containing protein [Magnetospirillum sp.]